MALEKIELREKYEAFFRGLYREECDVSKNSYIFKCSNTGFFSSCDGKFKLEPCSCGWDTFVGGTSSGGSKGIFCKRCERGFTVWKCPKCGTSCEVGDFVYKEVKHWYE